MAKVQVSEEALKSSFIHRKAELEVDKLFRACVKLQASDLQNVNAGLESGREGRP